jgi:hypothetical protein
MNMHPSAEAMLDVPTEWRPRRFDDWALAARTVALLWGFYVFTVVARAFLSTDPLTVLQNKVLMFLAGVVLTGAIYLAIAWLAPGSNLRRKAVVAGAGSLLASLAMAGVLVSADGHMRTPNVVVQRGNQITIERKADSPVVFTAPRLQQFKPGDRFRFAADTAVVWLFFFAAWSAVYLAAVSQRQALALQRRAALAETAAQAAQVRALRYQVNPHFLFNTLNSLSSLVMTGREQEAESMILKLSTFFRTSLSLDPNADVTLEEEIELQRLYLDIEKVRFPRRLKVEIDVPPELRGARLPALVLQPVVENGIKYGVSATKDKVTLRISARSPQPGRLELEVSNFGGTALKSPRNRHHSSSTGVGLANVCQRLDARFGRDASCSFGPLPDGGYQVVMTLPLTEKDG